MFPCRGTQWRLPVIILIAMVNFCALLFAQNSPTKSGPPLILSDAPALIPEPVPDSTTFPLDPVPILAHPTLFPQDSARTKERTAARVNQRDQEPTAAAATTIDNSATGAASAFGSDDGAGSLTRPSVAGAQAERERQRIMARAERQANLEHYNVKIGPIPFRFGAGVEFQFSDNANLSKSNKLADLSIVPHVDMYGGIRLSRLNTLSIQLGIGYIWNLNRPELDRTLTNASVGLDSDSGISFDIKVGSFRINLHERPAIPRQQFDLITQRNPLQYSQFTNVAGVTVFWDVNSRLSATLQYDHLNVVSLKSEIENLDQSSDLIGASATYRLNHALSIGLQANASLVAYKREFLNETRNYDTGLTLTARTGRNTTLRVIAGYQIGEFGSSGAIGDETSLSDWYLRLGVTRNINRYLSQSISVGHESQIGTVSNSTEVDYIRHQLNMAFARVFGLGTTAFFDSAIESGGVLAHEFKLYQFGVYGYWRLSTKMSVSFSYRFVKRESTPAADALAGTLDYVENRFDLGFQLNL